MGDTKIYVASPFGFSESGRKFYYEELILLLIEKGYKVIDPWTLTPANRIKEVQGMEYGKDKKESWQELNYEIASRNKEAIDSADLIIAILDGVDVDSGTASEVGYGFARGKKILGYRGDFRLSGDNEGAVVNLQVEYFIKESGGDIVTKIADISKVLVKLTDI